MKRELACGIHPTEGELFRRVGFDKPLGGAEAGEQDGVLQRYGHEWGQEASVECREALIRDDFPEAINGARVPAVNRDDTGILGLQPDLYGVQRLSKGDSRPTANPPSHKILPALRCKKEERRGGRGRGDSGCGSRKQSQV